MKVVLDRDAKMPTRAHATDAGFDLYARENQTVHGKSSAVFNTGVHVELPKDTCGLLVSKSGLNVNNDITSTGLIDQGYTGPIVVKLYNNGNKPYEVKKGDKITQLVILPIVQEFLQQVETLDDTDRGTGGFGSSGK